MLLQKTTGKKVRTVINHSPPVNSISRVQLQDGAIKQYYILNNINMNRTILEDNTHTLMKCENKGELEIAEVIYILKLKPIINIQCNRMGLDIETIVNPEFQYYFVT